MNILVLDVGTSGMRGTLLDDASVLYHEQISYGPDYCGNGIVEQNPDDWLAAAEKLCAAAAQAAEVDAVALSCQRSSVIPVGKAGEALTPAIMWQDTRNRELCRDMAAQEGRIRALSGAGINTVFSGGKMAWLRQERPTVYAAAEHLFVIPEYLVFHMTGACVLDHTYGSRSMLMDIRKRIWSSELTELFGVDEHKLGRLVLPSSVAGKVTDAFACRTGLRPEIPVVTCGGDQQCAALGQGVFREGVVSVNLGTGAYLITPVNSVPEEMPAGCWCNASAVPEQYILERSVLTCGSALNWFMREIGRDMDIAQIGKTLSASPPGAGGVVALPYFQGHSDPDWNSEGYASFHAMTLSTSREDMLRALLEGICVAVSRSLETMCADIACIHVSGGLSRTPEICQLLADVTGRPVRRIGGDDATTRGAWMSASRCLGQALTWDEAWERIRPPAETLLVPVAENTALYEKLREKMDVLYDAERIAGERYAGRTEKSCI